jgi:hypothetical protein
MTMASKSAKSLNERLVNLPGDAEIYIAETPTEIEFLRQLREADEVGKRRLDNLLAAARRGDLPSVDVIKTMTKAQSEAFLDALPDAAA